MKKRYYFVCFIIAALLSAPLSLNAQDKMGLSNKQTVYVPAYSHIYFGNRERAFLLTVTLSIRNIDPNNSIKIKNIGYYETQGNLLKKILDETVILSPLGSVRYIIPEKEKFGGSGANFIVQWEADKFVNPPIIESIMIGAKSGQGISFTSRGQVVLATD